MIKRDTYRYAKRQMTWFAAEREIVWLSPADVDAAAERIGRFSRSVVTPLAGGDHCTSYRFHPGWRGTGRTEPDEGKPLTSKRDEYMGNTKMTAS